MKLLYVSLLLLARLFESISVLVGNPMNAFWLLVYPDFMEFNLWGTKSLKIPQMVDIYLSPWPLCEEIEKKWVPKQQGALNHIPIKIAILMLHHGTPHVQTHPNIIGCRLQYIPIEHIYISIFLSSYFNILLSFIIYICIHSWYHIYASIISYKPLIYHVISCVYILK